MAISALSRLDKRGGSRVVTNAARDAVDAAASGAMRVRRAGFPVSGHGAQDDRRCSVRQNRVVLTPVAGAKLPVANSVQPDRLRHQAGSHGGKRNSSPGRARHKPSNHCAGDAGVLRLYLYARVRNSLHHCTRDRGCSKHPAFPAPSSWRERFMQTSGAMRRENAKLRSGVIVSLVRNCAPVRVIQYSRDINDRIDRPQRTGCPAFAGHDGGACGQRVARQMPPRRAEPA